MLDWTCLLAQFLGKGNPKTIIVHVWPNDVTLNVIVFQVVTGEIALAWNVFLIIVNGFLEPQQVVVFPQLMSSYVSWKPGYIQW